MKVLADTSVWVAHFKQPNALLGAMLGADQVLMHPMVLGEIACGTPPDRQRTLMDLATLGQVTLPPKNVSLAGCLNSRKENGNDKNGKSPIHARIQARGSATGGGRSKHCGSGALPGSG